MGHKNDFGRSSSSTFDPAARYHSQDAISTPADTKIRAQRFNTESSAARRPAAFTVQQGHTTSAGDRRAHHNAPRAPSRRRCPARPPRRRRRAAAARRPARPTRPFLGSRQSRRRRGRTRGSCRHCAATEAMARLSCVSRAVANALASAAHASTWHSCLVCGLIAPRPYFGVGVFTTTFCPARKPPYSPWTTVGPPADPLPSPSNIRRSIAGSPPPSPCSIRRS
jgi:hypothetical protein